MMLTKAEVKLMHLLDKREALNRQLLDIGQQIVALNRETNPGAPPSRVSPFIDEYRKRRAGTHPRRGDAARFYVDPMSEAG